MSIRGRVLKGAAMLSIGQGVGQALSLVRNMIVARMISPEDFGIAATFALTVSLLEMISDLAADKLLIQSRDGDDEGLQATAQLWQFMRGMVNALLMAAVAWPMSRLFRVPQAQWAFYWLAVVPFLRGFVHLDLKRQQRGMKFTPQILSEVGSQALITAAAWPLAHWLRSYSAVLWLVILQTGAIALLSHVTAQRPYRWAYDRMRMRRLLVFGWPLLVNGVLIVAIFQGDRLVVGALYGMQDLATYSAAFALAAAPTTFLGSVVGAIVLPVLSRNQDNPTEFRYYYVVGIQILATIGSVLIVTFMLLQSQMMGVAYGPAYAGNAVVLACLGVMQAMRLFRMGPVGAGLAIGDSASPLLANCWRAGALPAGTILAMCGAPVYWMAICACVGEVAGCCVSARRLGHRSTVSAGEYTKAVFLLALAVLVGAAVPSIVRGPRSFVQELAGWALVNGTLLVVAAALFDEARKEMHCSCAVLRGVLFRVLATTLAAKARDRSINR